MYVRALSPILTIFQYSSISFAYLVPLAIAAPAILAGAAWLNAKAQLYYDFELLSALFRGSLTTALNERRDRLNLFYSLEKHATTKGTADRCFIAYNGKEWNFREVYNITLKYGTWLKEKYVIAPMEVVAMDFMNSPQFVFLWLAIWSLGARPAFINYNLTSRPLLHCIRTSTARVVLVDDENKGQFTPDVLEATASPVFRDGKGPVQVVFFDEALKQQVLGVEGKREPDSVRGGPQGHDMACLIFTSGTTGLPKPAIVSWAKCSIGGIFTALFLLKPSDRFYTVCLSHSSSLPILARKSTHNCAILTPHLVYASLSCLCRSARVLSLPRQRYYLYHRSQIQH